MYSKNKGGISKMKLTATYTPQVYKHNQTSGQGGYMDGEPQTVMIIQITQFGEIDASILFIDKQGNIGEDNIHRFSNIEGAW